MTTFIRPENKTDEPSHLLEGTRLYEQCKYDIKIRINNTRLEERNETFIEQADDSESEPLVLVLALIGNLDDRIILSLPYDFRPRDFTDDETIYWYWESGEAGQYTLFFNQKPYLNIDNPLQTKCQYTLAAPRLFLTDSTHYLILPNGVEQLESLDIQACFRLTNLDCLLNLAQLKLLNLRGCNTLNDLDALQNLTELTELDLSGCHNLTNVNGLQNLTQLRVLNTIWCTGLTNVNGLQNLTRLETLDLNSCGNLTNVDGLRNLTRLATLDLSGCENLTNIDGLSNLTRLETLDLSSCESLNHVDGLQNLTHLTELDLSDCENLTNIDGLSNLTRLETLDLSSCKNLNHVDVLQNLTQLTKLVLRGCGSLTNVDGLRNLTHLTELDLSGCKNLTNVDRLQDLTRLIKLNLGDCHNLTNVDGLRNLTHLTELDLSGCKNLTNVDGLQDLTRLVKLNLGDCHNLTNVNGLRNLTQLTKLVLRGCGSLTNVDGLSNLTRLVTLDLKSCENLTNVDGLQNLTRLETLDLSSCKNLNHVDVLQNLTQLTKLVLRGCGSLTNVDGLRNLTHLTELDLCCCHSLTNVDGLQDLTRLIKLNLGDCESLNHVDGLQNLTHLTELGLSGCENLSNVDGLQKLTHLETLDLTCCNYLSSIAPLSGLPNLKRLTMVRCSNVLDVEVLREHPALEELHWDRDPIMAHFVLLSSLTGRKATDKIKEHSIVTKSASITPYIRDLDWQISVLGKALVLAEALEVYRENIILLNNYHQPTLEQWQSYFEHVIMHGSKSYQADFFALLTIKADGYVEDREKFGNKIDLLGGLLCTLISAPLEYRELTLQFTEKVLQNEAFQDIQKIAPTVCLLYEKIGDSAKATQWLKKFTDQPGKIWTDKIQQSLALWEIEHGNTESALIRVVHLHNPKLRDQTLTDVILILADKEPAMAGKVLNNIHSDALRKYLAQALQDKPSFTAFPENNARLMKILLDQEPYLMYFKFWNKLAQQKHLSVTLKKFVSVYVKLLIRKFIIPNIRPPAFVCLFKPHPSIPIIVDEKEINEKFLNKLRKEGILTREEYMKSRSFLVS